jgi:signal transduction histidine kinase
MTAHRIGSLASEVGARIGDRVRGAAVWMRTLPAPVVDVSIAAVFVVVVVADKIQHPPDGTGRALVSGGLTVALTAGLCMRRLYPLTACIVGEAVVAIESVLDVASAVTPYGGQVLVYFAGLYATRARSWWVPPVIVAGVIVYFAGRVDTSSIDPIGVLFVWLATWGVGYSVARRREEQDRSRRAIRRQVVADEHTRMARELHDLIGHTVNLLVVQAGAARVMLDTEPATTRALLTGMEETGRDALADLDQVVGTLREDSEPGPGLAGLAPLVSRLNDAQVHVSLSIDAGLRLPRNLDLSAYRIVQEALTNVLKHAAPCSAQVAVHRDAGLVVIDVSDDGRGMATPHAPGRALIGIAERVSACGGSLEYGPGKARGFTLQAVLPLP